jgi:ABC-type lipoprotein export system ATPase subunit
MSALLVHCVDVARTYGRGRSAVVALHRVSCTVEAGEQIALVGPSGSGKSTLLHLMAGIDDPTAGEITWPAIGDRKSLRPGPVGMVFQGTSLIPSLDVLENVAFPLLLAGADPAPAADEANAALARLGLEDLAPRLPEEISGGQAQRVAIARVLVGTPRLILADEPTGQLDRDAAALVFEQLITAAETTGAALVVSTHDATVAERLHRRWSMLDGGLAVPPGRAHPALALEGT